MTYLPFPPMKDVQACQNALEAFFKNLPHRKIEEFKYTDLSKRIEQFPVYANKNIPLTTTFRNDFSEIDAFRIEFHNGFLSSKNISSLPKGVSFVDINTLSVQEQKKLLEPYLSFKGIKDNALISLNRHIAQSCFVLKVDRYVSLEKPLHLQFSYGDQSSSSLPLCFVILEDHASCTLIESHNDFGDCLQFVDSTINVQMGEEAQFFHIRLNAMNKKSHVFSNFLVELGVKAVLKSWNVALGGKTARHQIFCKYAGDNAEAHLNGVQMVRGDQLIDTTLQMDHAEPGGISRELFKTVVQDNATGVFQGKIIVEPHAQKTDGQMMSAALLLSDSASMNNKPELEIYADDVVCAHGATCGQIDEELLFYLMSRGISKAQAESLVMKAFLSEALEDIEHEAVKDILDSLIAQWLLAR